jgi:hypothetical protein
MPDLTPRLGIKKPLGNENVTRASFNENWDIIDAKVATLGPDGKVPASQLNVSSNASSITVADAGNYYTATDAEGALQEIGQTLVSMRGSLITSMNSILGA